MKQTINLGAFGWLHTHWINSYYPEDLPEDWRLGYYSNEFNTVLVPAVYWQDMRADVCEGWMDDVHQDFRFFVECNIRMFDDISPAEFAKALLVLKPQLSGLVFLDEQPMPDIVYEQFTELVDEAGVEVFGADIGPQAQQIWRPGCKPGEPPEMSRFALIEDDLTEPRSGRSIIEPFTMNLDDDKADSVEATLIVSHPRLQASDLARFRSVLEIMGH